MDREASQPRVFVHVSDDRLRGAISTRLRQVPDIEVADRKFDRLTDGPASTPGTIVVATTADINPAACYALQRGGIGVVVLTPVMRDRERISYTECGSSYIAMHVDMSELVETIRRAASEQAQPRA